MSKQKVQNVCVVVLGDIGRSPRMQYHSLSLANKGYNVNIIGYEQTKVNYVLNEYDNIHIHPMISFPAINYPRIITYFFKTIWQIFTLFCALAFKNADYVLVQNPPAVPTLFVCGLYCLVTRAKFIIDWHNYAYTIMALSNGKNSILVKITEWMESYFGQLADANLCVTEAMKEDLEHKWFIKATVLYDKPSSMFKPISVEDKHEFILRFGKEYPIFSGKNSSETAFTIVSKDETEIELKEHRPALLVSSTSWTEDEDFSILLTALEKYEESYKDGNKQNLPKLICAITGMGPLKFYYMEKIQRKKMKHVVILTPWLETADYPLLLASADLGVCLHTSSSGLDLPMKVVDMFGCCLPVCAIDFKCLPELVKNEENGYTFTNSQELATLVIDWFTDFPNNKTQKEKERKFKENITEFQNIRWEENWEQNASPLFM